MCSTSPPCNFLYDTNNANAQISSVFSHTSVNFNVGWTQIFESKFSSFPLRSRMRALFCANESNSNVEFKGLLTFPQFSLPPRHTLLAPFFPQSQKWSQPPPHFCMSTNTVTAAQPGADVRVSIIADLFLYS